MRVLIVGCGYVGLPLGVELVRLGHEVSGLRRNAAVENEMKAAGITAAQRRHYPTRNAGQVAARI